MPNQAQKKTAQNSTSETPKNGRKKPEEKAELLQQVIDMKAAGENDFQISKALNIHAATVKKWWGNYLETTEKVLPAHLVIERLVHLEKCVNKTIRDFHADKCTVRDVVVAIESADKYNGVADHLKRISIENQTTQNQAPLLNIIVQNVDIEYPPE
jgi:transposase-like protein